MLHEALAKRLPAQALTLSLLLQFVVVLDQEPEKRGAVAAAGDLLQYRLKRLRAVCHAGEASASPCKRRRCKRPPSLP